MPPIQMSRQERATLERLAVGPAPIGEVPLKHQEKFVVHGLAERDAFRFRITAKGQLELFRQRYRNMTLRRRNRLSNVESRDRRVGRNGKTPRSLPVLSSTGEIDD